MHIRKTNEWQANKKIDNIKIVVTESKNELQ